MTLMFTDDQFAAMRGTLLVRPATVHKFAEK